MDYTGQISKTEPITQISVKTDKLSDQYTNALFSEVLNALIQEFVSVNDYTANFMLHHSDFGKMNCDILRTVLINLDELDSELFTDYIAYLKIYLIKTNFKHLDVHLKTLYKMLSHSLDDEKYRPRVFKSILSIFHVLFSCTSYYDQTSTVMLSGLTPGFRVDFDNAVENHRFFLNQNFTMFMVFNCQLVDANNPANEDETVFPALITFKNRYNSIGYGLQIIDNSLVFVNKVSEQLSDKNKEVVVFSNLSDIINGRWTTFIFSCEYVPKPGLSILTFILNDRRYSIKLAVENAFAKTTKHTLHILDYIAGELTAFMAIDKAAGDKIYKDIGNAALIKGIVNLEGHQRYTELFAKYIENKSMRLWFSPLSTSKVLADEIEIYSMTHNKEMVGNLAGVMLNESNPVDFDLAINGLQTSDLTLVLLNYVQDPKELELVLKVLNELLGREQYVEFQFQNCKRNLFEEMMGAFIGSSCYNYIDDSTMDILIQNLFSLSGAYRAKYLNNFVLNFHFIDKFLVSEESAKTFFNLMLKNLDHNPDLLAMLDLNSLLDIYITLLHTGSYLNTHKANSVFSILKLKIIAEQDIDNCKLEPLLYYLNDVKFDRMGSLNNTVKLLELFLPSAVFVKRCKDKIIYSLFNIISKIDDCLLLARAYDIILSLDGNIEHMLVALWRHKILKDNSSDKLKRVYRAYSKERPQLNNLGALTNFVLSLLFDISKDTDLMSPDEYKFKKQPHCALFFELSLALDCIGLQNVLQVLLVSLRQRPKSFVESFKKTSMSAWIISIIVSSAYVETKSALYDLAFKLYSLHLYHSIKDCNDLGPLIYSFELIGYYTQEPGCEKLNFELLYGILKLFNEKDVCVTHEQAIHVLVANLFKFYFLNLNVKPDETSATRTYIELLNFLHRTINLNSNQNIMHVLSKSLLASSLYSRIFSFNALNTSKQYLSMNSSFTTDQSMNKDKETQTFPLKLVTLIVLDMLKYFNELGKYSYLAIVFKFISGFFHEILFYIEINRSKLKPPRVIQIEACLYYIIIDAFKDERNKDFIGEIKNDIMKMGAADIEHSFSTNIIELADLYQNTTHDLFFKVINKRIMNNAFYIGLYDDRSFTTELHDFVLNTVGEINDKIKDRIEFYESLDVKYEVFEKLLFIRNTYGAEFHIELMHFINSYLIERKLELQRVKSVYHKLYKGQRQPWGTLFRAELERDTQSFSLFNPKQIEYVDDNTSVSFKHRNIMTKDNQRPFVKISIKPYYKRVNWKTYDDYIDKFRIAQHLSNKDCYFFRVEYIKKLFIFESFIAIDKSAKMLSLCYDFSEMVPRTNNLQISNFALKPYKKYSEDFPLDNITEVHEYKFLQLRTALEIFFANRTSIVVNFNNRNVMEDFAYLLLDLSANIRVKTINTKKISKSYNIKEKWSKDGKMSNFEYIMAINSLSSRSINDFSQYPIFPMIIKKTTDGLKLRDLSRPIGMTGEERRIKTYQKRFDADETFADHPKYYYGSHYSSPAIVFHYLVRLKPYTDGCKSIQNGTFDLPDRLFFSIEHMLKNISEEMSDVRELIPEAFYLPAMYINFNKYNFGTTQTGFRVNNVELPQSFNKNPYKFIYELRKLLESKEVSESLGNWVDLIFGCKQQGQAAIDACNVFYHITYEDQVKKLNYENDKEKQAIDTQIYHFGQIPFQLFINSHPNRRIGSAPATIISPNAQVKYFLKKREDNFSSINRIHLMKEIKVTYSAATKRTVIKIVVVKDKNVEYYKFNTIAPSMAGNNVPFEFVLASNVYIDRIKRQLAPKGFDNYFSGVVEFYGEDRLMLGGFKGGTVAIISLKSLKVINEFKHHYSVVSSLRLSNNDVLLSADLQGIISISSINTSNDTLQRLYTIYDHYGSQIRNIDFYTDDQEFFIINSDGGVVDVRCVFKPKTRLFRITNELSKDFKPKFPCDCYFSKALLSFSYVSTVITYSYVEKRNYLHSFSLEGRLIARYTFENEHQERLEHFLLVKDEYFKENLIACNSSGDIFIFDLPFFDNGRKIASTQSIDVTAVIPVNNRKTLLLGDDKGIIDIFSLLNE